MYSDTGAITVESVGPAPLGQHSNKSLFILTIKTTTFASPTVYLSHDCYVLRPPLSCNHGDSRIPSTLEAHTKHDFTGYMFKSPP